MNYLAHLYLSQQKDNLIVGNFIGDQIKGANHKNYSSEIALGILLHREIDSFMDAHPIVMQGKERLHKTQGKFAGVVIDVFYDYFLASNWSNYHDLGYNDFIQSHYEILNNNISVMPDLSQYILGRMTATDWLGQYSEIQGINRALSGLSHRTKYENNMQNAVDDLLTFETEFAEEFKEYFPSVIQHCKNFIQNNGKA